MLVVIHIVVALSGLVCSTVAFIAPSRVKINATYGLIALTVASGTLLVMQTHAPVLSSCIAGLTYVGVVLAGALAAKVRLARQSVEN